MSRAAYNFNRRVEAFIDEKQRMQVPFSKSDLAYLNRYTGYGGLAKFGAEGKGLLSEYFTPVELVEKMMGLAYQHGYVDGPVLEPSCGIGRFLHYLPKETKVDAFEINPTSWQIAKANFPDYHIFNQYFNELFVTRTGAAKQFEAKYQLVIGNPPYGDFIGQFTTKERATTKATRYEDYFITRGLDLLLPSGLLIYVIPSGFLDGKESAVKQLISEKAMLLDAYRLPKGIFNQTDIQTDIVVFFKK